MRNVFLLTILIGSTTSSAADPTVFPAADETALRATHDAFAKAWSAGDVKALLPLFADDAVRVGARGDVQNGKAQIKEAFEKLLAGPFKGASVKLSPPTLRMLSAELALKEGPFEIAVAGGPPVQGFSVEVMKKVNGAWLILETHPKLFPPAPPPPPQKR